MSIDTQPEQLRPLVELWINHPWMDVRDWRGEWMDPQEMGGKGEPVWSLRIRIRLREGIVEKQWVVGVAAGLLQMAVTYPSLVDVRAMKEYLLIDAQKPPVYAFAVSIQSAADPRRVAGWMRDAWKASESVAASAYRPSAVPVSAPAAKVPSVPSTPEPRPPTTVAPPGSRPRPNAQAMTLLDLPDKEIERELAHTPANRNEIRMVLSEYPEITGVPYKMGAGVRERR